MKISKEMKLATLAVSLALLILLGARVRADSPPLMRALGTPVSAIHITGLDAYAGKYLNVFYVAGSPQAFGVRGEVLYVSTILQIPVLRIEIPTNGEVLVPATRVKRLPFVAFNNVLFEISDSLTNPLFLRNPDDSTIKDPRLGPDESLANKPDSEFKGQRIGFIGTNSLNHLPRSGNVIQLDASKDLRQ